MLVTSSTPPDAVDTQTNVSGIHCTLVESQEGTGGENQLVSIAYILITTESILTIT